jgi:hypothetical protein
MCSDDDETLSLITQAAKGKQGKRTDLINNVNKVGSSTPEGNSRQAALRSLRKNAPAIHNEVISGKLSAHAGMIKAGLRRKTFER